MCTPAVLGLTMEKPEFMRIPPFVLITVKPTGAAAVIVVPS